MSELVFKPEDSYYVARSKILARQAELVEERKEQEEEKDEVEDDENDEEQTLVGSPREVYVSLSSLPRSMLMSSLSSSHVDDSASLAAMLQAFINISDSARGIRQGISNIESCLRNMSPE